MPTVGISQAPVAMESNYQQVMDRSAMGILLMLLTDSEVELQLN